MTSRRITRRWLGTGISSAALLMPGQQLVAAELNSQGTVMLSAEYNDNPRSQLRRDAQAMEADALAVTVPVDYVSEQSTAELMTRARTDRHHGVGAIDTEYFYADGKARRSFERGSVAIGAGWHRDSTIYNPFEAAGGITTTIRHTERLANASVERQADERTTLSFNSAWDEVRYRDGGKYGLYNYWYTQANAVVQHQLGERSSVSLTGGFGRYQIKDFDFLNDTPSAQLQWKGAVSENWSLLAGAGVSHLRTRLQFLGFVREKSITGTNFIASAQWQGERSQFALSATRSIQPTGFGAMLIEEQGSVSVTRSLAATVTASATARYSRQFDALRSLRYGDHRYGRLELSTTWQYSELTSFAIQLGYLRQRFDPTFPIVFGSSAYLTASHNFRPLRLK